MLHPPALHHAANKCQQLWHTCELRSNQLLPDWPPLTPLWGLGVLDGSVPGTPTQEVKPCMGSIDGGGSVELYPSEANTLAQRLSILTCSAPALISWVSNAPSFCLSVELFRNDNSSKSWCEAENMHWQDYCHLISSKYQNRDGKINIVHALCVKTDSTVLLNGIWLKLRESAVK